MSKAQLSTSGCVSLFERRRIFADERWRGKARSSTRFGNAQAKGGVELGSLRAQAVQFIYSSLRMRSVRARSVALHREAFDASVASHLMFGWPGASDQPVYQSQCSIC
jgi:hypothetical protein